MEIRPVLTEEQKREFDNPFPTPKGQIVQAYYAFFVPSEKSEVVERLAKALTDIDMNVKLFAVERGVAVKAQFRKPLRYAQAEPLILPILQKLDIPQFSVLEGDLATFDNQGELIGWISTDFMD